MSPQRNKDLCRKGKKKNVTRNRTLKLGQVRIITHLCSTNEETEVQLSLRQG